MESSNVLQSVAVHINDKENTDSFLSKCTCYSVTDRQLILAFRGYCLGMVKRGIIQLDDISANYSKLYLDFKEIHEEEDYGDIIARQKSCENGVRMETRIQHQILLGGIPGSGKTIVTTALCKLVNGCIISCDLLQGSGRRFLTKVNQISGNSAIEHLFLDRHHHTAQSRNDTLRALHQSHPVVVLLDCDFNIAKRRIINRGSAHARIKLHKDTKHVDKYISDISEVAVHPSEAELGNTPFMILNTTNMTVVEVVEHLAQKLYFMDLSEEVRNKIRKIVFEITTEERIKKEWFSVLREIESSSRFKHPALYCAVTFNDADLLHLFYRSQLQQVAEAAKISIKSGFHCTLRFYAPEKDSFKTIPKHPASVREGEAVSIIVTGCAWDSNCMVFLVTLPQNLDTDNVLPHITIGLKRKIGGSYSNEMLIKGKYKRFNFAFPVTIDGKIETVHRK